MTTQTRLDAYLAAEADILQAQEIRGTDRTHRMAELEEVRAAIKDLEAQLNRETASAAGDKFRHSLANLNRTG